MDRRLSRGVQLLLVALLFVLAAGVGATVNPQVSRVSTSQDQDDSDVVAPGRQPSERVSPRPARSPSEDMTGLSPALVTVVTGALFLVVLTVLGAILWRSIRDQVTVRRAGPDAALAAARREREVRAAVQAGLEDLAADGTDPRAVVIACWLRLEKAAWSAGVDRGTADTAGDLVAKLLAEQRVSGAVLDRFATVYRQARYAPHEVGTELRDEARQALRQLDAELAARRTAAEAVSETGQEVAR